MASADQIKALLRAYVAGDDPQFLSVANQVAAREAKLGHAKLAQEIVALIEEAKAHAAARQPTTKPIPIAQPKGELAGMLSVSYPKHRLSDMVLQEDMRFRLERVVKEQRQAASIQSYGLSPTRKMLLLGQPGTGKTLSAAVLAGELSLPLFVVRLEGLITKFMGESAAKLRLVFDNIAQTRGVYLFDEFDSIGSQRGFRNDVGEMRRVLNSFLQFIEGDESASLILAATNHPELLDRALFRRFDDILEFTMPDDSVVRELLQVRLALFNPVDVSWERLVSQARGLSHAEISKAAENAIKAVVIGDRDVVRDDDVLAALEERRTARRH